MGDILSALSIVFGILFAIFLQWFPDISKASKTKYNPDKAQDIDFVTTTQRYKVAPLLVASLVLTFIILPLFVDIVWESLVILYMHSYNAFAHYDIILSVILYISCLSITLSWYLVSCFLKMRKELKKKP